MRTRSTFAASLATAVGLALVGIGASPYEVNDRVDLVHVDQQILAIRGQTGAVLEMPLEVGERVLDVQSVGLMGVASTSTRLLGITAHAPDWTVLRYRLAERSGPAPRLYVQERVAMVALPQRVVALSPRLKTWAETALSPGESDPEVLIDDDVAALITPRRAIGFSATSGDFAEERLSPREVVLRRSVGDSSITLVTDRRVLIFRSGSDAWTEVDRKKKN